MPSPMTVDEAQGASAVEPVERTRRSVALTIQLTLAPLFTAAAALAGWASARRIRGLLPDYPQQIALGAYSPNRVYRALHLFGTAGLVALLVLVHLALLVAVLLAYGLSAANLAGALTVACPPGR